MMRLKSKLLSLNSDKATKTKIFSPANTEELRIPFKMEKTAKVVGRLAQTPPPKSFEDERLITGVLVQNDFKMSLMAPEDLREYAGLTTTTITCKQRLTLSAAGVELIRWALEGTFGSIEELGPKKKPTSNGTAATNGNSTEHDIELVDEDIDRSPHAVAFLVMGCVIVRYENNGHVTVEWEGNMLNDGIADSVLAVLFTVESSPAAVKRKCSSFALEALAERWIESSKSQQHNHSRNERNPHSNISPEERFSRLCMFLEAQFGPMITPITHPKIPPKQPKPAIDANGIKNEPADGNEPEEDPADLEAEEMERLHSIGIPVPGVEIKFDKHVAKVWLETLEVECTSPVLRERVKAVIERAVETVAPLWAQKRR